MKQPIFILSVIGFVILSVSCPTSPEPRQVRIPPLSEVIVNDIRAKIDKGLLMSSLQDVSYAERESVKIEKDEINKLYDEIYARIKTLYDDKIKTKDYRGALGIFISLENTGKNSLLPDWSKTKLEKLIASDYEANGNQYLAIGYYIKAAQSGALSDAETLHAAELAYQLQNRRALTLLIRELDKRNLPVDEKIRKLEQSVPSITDLMKGTTVIWVDRGVKIENGMGLPDIVLGSGFFIDNKGYIITNHHVIASEVDAEYEGFSKLYVKLPANINEKIPAKVVGYDRLLDVALLKLEMNPPFIYTFAGPVKYGVGEKVSAIGAPLGLENTVTSGILSNVSRRFLQMGDVIQVDAPVNPGNSGGPLLDEKYNLIGIVFAGLEKFEGLNFAIPFNYVEMVLPEMYKGGEVSQGWLGVCLYEGSTIST
jgi:serine protease Do